MGKKALILSSGSIEGAFQVGALKKIFDSGFEPDIIAGNGIGALHAIFIANELGRFNKQITFPQIASMLERFWIKNILSPQSIIKRRSLSQLAYHLLKKKFISLYDSSALENIILNRLRVEHIIKSPIEVIIGAIDTYDGQTRYFTLKDSQLIDAIFASYSIPFVLPYVFIDNHPYIDAAERNIIPSSHILENYNIDQMIIILCQPVELDELVFNPGNLNKLIYRIKHISENELLLRDLELINEYAQKHPKFKITIIKPEKELFVSFTDFTHKDIKEMIRMGHCAAQKAISTV